MYYTEYGTYPITMTSTDSNVTLCPTAPKSDNSYCIKASGGSTFKYSIDPINGFILYVTKDTNTYSITKDSSPINWITIGSQTWASKNLNVGTMIPGANNQTNNSTVEKYCYNNDEANCTTYGALYQWDEAMNYSNVESAQGICPANSHIPSDAEWKTLEMSLGMTQTEADKSAAWRGTNQGTQLKSGGSSGFNVPIAGIRYTDGLFYYLSSDTYLWPSSESSTSAWFRYLPSGLATVNRDTHDKAFGFNIRCLKN